MAKENATYVCKICGNRVLVIESGQGTLVCCGEEMKEELMGDNGEES